MRHGIIVLAALLFVGPTLSAPAAAAQEARSPGMELERSPDGFFALPRENLAPLRLVFDAAGSPFELIGLRWDPENGRINATLQLDGDRKVSAWAVQVATVSTSGKTMGVTRKTDDWSFLSEAGGANRLEAKGFVTRTHRQGLLHPYQIESAELGISMPTKATAAEVGRLVLSVPVAIYADTSFTGSPGLAREILGARAAAAEELADWSVRIDDAISAAGEGPDALGHALDALRAIDRELAAEAPGLPASAQAVRHNLYANLEPVLRQAADQPDQAVRALQDLAGWVHDDLAARLENIPDELPGAPATHPGGEARHSSDSVRPRVAGDPGTLNCDCGGQTIANSTTTESQICNLSAGWHVDESWDFHCKAEDGRDLGEGNGALHGVGGCVNSGYLICFPGITCPPFFTRPAVSHDSLTRYWVRTVTNYQVLFGLCTVRCGQTDSSSLTRTCLCEPKPQPGCDIDGCPVLLETGAGGFTLTDLAGGVAFDLDADGSTDRVSWTTGDGDDAWLALDRNGNGAIDDGGELFGDKTDQPPSDEPNGFLALAVFDRIDQGGNGDGLISAADAVFPSLRLWLDRDHDGITDAGELESLPDAGIAAIELDYFASRRRDRFGNRFRYATKVWLASGGRRLATDVFLRHD